MSEHDPRHPLPSRRDEQGRYIHPWPLRDGASRGFRDLMRWQMQRVRYGVEPDPPGHAFPVATPDVAQPRATADELRITWVGHSTFLIQLGRVNILTDPVWSRRASPLSWIGPSRLVAAALAFDALPPIDVVLISHDHYDHLDERTVRQLHARYGSALQWVTPIGYHRWLKNRGVDNVRELDWWQHIALDVGADRVAIHATPAQHWTKRTPFNERTRLWASFVIESDAARVFFCGDSGYFDGFRAIGERFAPFTAVLLPIGAYEPRWFMAPAHMNPDEAVQTYVDLGAAGTFVSMHWGTFRLTDEPAFEPPRRTVEAWKERALPQETLWIARHGETRIMSVR